MVGPVAKQAKLYFLRVAVYLVTGPVVGGVAFDVWAMLFRPSHFGGPVALFVLLLL